MRIWSARRFVSLSWLITLAVVVVGCGKSGPTNPSAVVGAAVPAGASGAAASVSSVLPASLSPGVAPQTLIVTGANFQPGLSVTLAFTPSSGGAAPASRSVRTLDGPSIQNLTDTSFEVSVVVTTTGTYTLSVTNPSAPPSDPVTVTAQNTDSPQPTIAGTSPRTPVRSTATQGVYVAGGNFQNGLDVMLTLPDGTTQDVGVPNITFGTSTVFKMFVTLPVAGHYALTVVNPNGQSSSAWPFEVTSSEPPPAPTPTPTPPPTTDDGPSIEGISPKSPTVNGNSQTVYVGGEHFVAGLSISLTTPGGATTTIGGAAIQNVTSTTFQMTVTLPVTGSYSFSVTNPTGAASNVWPFTVKALETPPPPVAPAVTSISPSTPVAGSSWQPVYVMGSNFASGLTVNLTQPDGTTVGVGGSLITFGSSTVFQMRPTLAAVGTYSFVVLNPSGLSSTPFSFTVRAPEVPVPSVSGTSPRSPTQSSVPQMVFVGGVNFAAGLTVSLTSPSGVTATLDPSAVQNVTSTTFQMTVLLPEVGTYSMTVTNPSGKTSAPATFVVKAPETPAPPQVTGVSPSAPVVSTSAQPVYVFGTGFATGLTVQLTAPDGTTSTIAGASINVGSSTVFQMMLTLSQAGQYTFRVSNPSGLTSTAWAFTVKASQ